MFEVLSSFLGEWLYVLIALEAIFIIIMLFAERAAPEKVILWTLVFIILPIFGFLAYLVVGQTFYSDHTFRLKSTKDEEIKHLYAKEDKSIESDVDVNPDAANFAKTIKKLGGSLYSRNNDVTLYTVGQDKFDQMYKDLRNAKSFIHLEYYIIRDDELGNELMDILTEKVKEGVEVKLLTDDFGIGKGPHKAIKRFKLAGGEFSTFHSVVLLAVSPKKNNRNHRKLAVIDGDIAYCGGFNVGDEYLGKGPLGYWRDTAVRVRGGACLPTEIRFCMDWEYASGKRIERNDKKYLPSSMGKEWGDARIQLVSGGPDVAYKNPVRMQYLEMIEMAKKTVYIHTPYLIPNDSLIDSLRIAAASGVDVRIIIPDKPDHMFVYWNNISSANTLMESGVRVYMYNRGFVHSKTVVSDGQYCSVGSANFDDRSLVLNFETNMMIYSEEIGKQMVAAFEDDLKYCTEYSCEEYAKRTLMMKFRIGVSKLFRTVA